MKSAGALARLQQGLALGHALLAALLVAWLWQRGWSWLSLAGLLAVAAAHAAVLALEFAAVALVHGDDPTPRASVAQLLAAWWAEVRYASRVFGLWQPFLSQRWPDQVWACGPVGVVLVHGFVCNRGFWNPWLQQLTARQVPFVAVNLEPVFGSIEAYASTIEQAVVRLAQATGRPPVLVAHSMGGLAVRHWLSVQGQAQASSRVASIITLGTPHQGTWLARWAFSRNGVQMRRAQARGAWLQALQAREAALGPGYAGAFTCFYSHCDNIVFPASTATLPGARHIHLPAVAHVHMAARAEPWQALMQALNRGLKRPKPASS